jgi:hypothetical protein
VSQTLPPTQPQCIGSSGVDVAFSHWMACPCKCSAATCMHACVRATLKLVNEPSLDPFLATSMRDVQAVSFHSTNFEWPLIFYGLSVASPIAWIWEIQAEWGSLKY